MQKGTWHDQVPGTIWYRHDLADPVPGTIRSGTWHDQIITELIADIQIKK